MTKQTGGGRNHNVGSTIERTPPTAKKRIHYTVVQVLDTGYIVVRDDTDDFYKIDLYKGLGGWHRLH